jgi:signal transduction histidine kinase
MVATPGSLNPATLDASAVPPPGCGVHLVLEVSRGRTQFRRRPVRGPRFLIGSAPACDLRLGGEEIPALHSIIVVGQAGILLESIAAQPPLMVNGRGVNSTSLHDGDKIEIGNVELIARTVAGHAPAEPRPQPAARSVTESAARVGELSAAELIDLIEAEEAEVARYDDRRRAGAKALVDALMSRRRRGEADVPKAPVKAPHFLSKRPQVLAAQAAASQEDDERWQEDPRIQEELDELGRQLAALSHELKNGLNRATQREAQYAAATGLLLELQHKLVSQIEAVVSHVESLKSQSQMQGSPRGRAIA